MPTRNTEILVGVTVLLALAGVIWSVTALREVRIAEGTRRWTVRFSDVGGLAAEDPVTVHGVKKGAVKDIRLGANEVIVDFILSRDITLGYDTEVYVRNVGLMGEKFIAIENAGAGRPLTARRDTIEGIYESGIPEVISQMGSALISLERLSSSVDRVLTLAEERNTVRTTLTNMESGSAEFRRVMLDSRTDLREAIAQLRAASEAGRRIAESSEPQITGTLDDVRHATARVDAMAARMDSLAIVLGRVADKLDSGSGTAGRLMNDKKLYDDTQATMRELRLLVHDLRTNPSRYFKVSVF